MLPPIFNEMLLKLLHKAISWTLKLLQVWLQLMYPTLCSMLEIIAKFDDVGNCLYMFDMFYPLVLQL